MSKRHRRPDLFPLLSRLVSASLKPLRVPVLPAALSTTLLLLALVAPAAAQRAPAPAAPAAAASAPPSSAMDQRLLYQLLVG
jgi:hypothetical protein